VASTARLRVYLPLTSSSLRRAREEGAFGPAPLPGHAVTSALLEALGGAADEEDAEYTAMTAAGLESLTLLGDDDAPARVVAAVDVASWEPRPGQGDPSAVAVEFEVPLKRLAAVHVDGTDATAQVLAARDALRAEASADTGSDDLPEAVERCLDVELGWFAAQELDALLGDLALGSPGGRATIG
jgi:hypothetical protein